MALVIAAEERCAPIARNLVIGRDESFLECRRRDDDLERRTGRIAPLQHAVLQWPKLVGVERRPRHPINPGGEGIRVVGRQAGIGQHLAIAWIHDQRGAVEAGVAKSVFRRFLQVVVDGQLDATSLRRRNLLDHPHLAAHAVDDNASRAIAAHQQRVIRLFNLMLTDDVALHDVRTDLRLTGFAHVSEQVSGQRLRGILPRRYLFDHDIRKLEVETTGSDRRHLRQRGILNDDDRPVARLATMPIDDLLDLLRIEPGHL